MKTPNWLQWPRKKKPNDTKSETLKEVRRRTDQRLKQWERRDEAEKNSRVNGVHKDQECTGFVSNFQMLVSIS
jgi:hypothetical protein